MIFQPRMPQLASLPYVEVEMSSPLEDREDLPGLVSYSPILPCIGAGWSKISTVSNAVLAAARPDWARG